MEKRIELRGLTVEQYDDVYNFYHDKDTDVLEDRVIHYQKESRSMERQGKKVREEGYDAWTKFRDRSIRHAGESLVLQDIINKRKEIEKKGEGNMLEKKVGTEKALRGLTEKSMMICL